jgi:2-dehydro-3-deoxyphosphogluconate aldolase/(4S)-4-hydroxy-2-oxoglutarate aldolase
MIEIGAPVLPVVTIEHAEAAVPLAQALLRGGLSAIEVTLRTPAALQSIECIAAEVPQIAVGAGTVLNSRDLEAARRAGARFALSPGATPALLDAARSMSFPFIPGIATASELMIALEHGYQLVKFFPAEASGGAKAVSALHAPFRQARFCPTGGVSLANAPGYLALPCVPFVGGSWIAPADAIASGDWNRIESLARASAQLGR